MKQMAVKRNKLFNIFKKEYQLYLMLIPAILFFLIFYYWPMYGIQLGFKKYVISEGITGSPWIGFDHFIRFFSSYWFPIILKNTIVISLAQLIFEFPIPIIFALMLNQVKNMAFKKTVQTVSYAPHFISLVVLVGMMGIMLSPTSGVVNMILKSLGLEPVFFLGESAWFKPLFVMAGIWQNFGWSSIIYIAALAGINPEIYEAADMDGASKFQKIINVDLPGIMPTAVILLIMRTGKIMQIGFQKAFLMQNPLNIESGEIIATYIYKSGLLSGQYEYSTAISLFNTVINFILLISINNLSRKINQISLW